MDLDPFQRAFSRSPKNTDPSDIQHNQINFGFLDNIGESSIGVRWTNIQVPYIKIYLLSLPW